MRVVEDEERLEQRAHAARLGMWVFLASELLLFTGLLALYASYRAHDPSSFQRAVHHNTKVLGSINTAVLLASSALAASSVHALRGGRRRRAIACMLGTCALGSLFLGIKVVEYRSHFAEGIYPGGVGRYFAEEGARGAVEYWTLYFATTGLHAIHVTIGLVVLGTLTLSMLRGRLAAESSHRLELGATYWHLVDVIWIFVWPLYYLA